MLEVWSMVKGEVMGKSLLGVTWVLKKLALEGIKAIPRGNQISSPKSIV